jgi:hypothetical protein
MYTKLALRNAKRSIFNYLLYITTMTILIAIMYVSNCIAIFGNIQAGFQTASLPLLIVVIMVALVNYINTFMMKQRAKEFANYLLLGMEKSKLLKMFLLEICFIGIVCFIFGGLIGLVAYLAFFSNELQGAEIRLTLTVNTILQTFFFFCIVEILSAIRMSRKIYKLQICELMNENRRNQSLGGNKQKFGGIWFCISLFSLILLLYGIVFWPENFAYTILSFISIPLICCIFTFYNWMYAHFSSKRLAQSENLYRGNRLYYIAEMTTGTKTSALMSSIFCICLLFAILSFVFGTLLFNKELDIFAPANQQWMGFLQISISIIFIVIYFSILSLQQIIELKRQSKSILILYYMGKNKSQIKSLIKMQVMLKLVVPTLMCFVLLLVCTPFINYKMNIVLPSTIHNSLINAVGGFIACFVILYICYFKVVYITSIRYVKMVIKF